MQRVDTAANEGAKAGAYAEPEQRGGFFSINPSPVPRDLVRGPRDQSSAEVPRQKRRKKLVRGVENHVDAWSANRIVDNSNTSEPPARRAHRSVSSRRDAEHAADPTTPIYWSAEKTAEIMREAAARVNKETGMSPQRFGDSMFLMDREKTSGAEAHNESADYIIVNGGTGTIVVGGKILNGISRRRLTGRA